MGHFSDVVWYDSSVAFAMGQFFTSHPKIALDTCQLSGWPGAVWPIEHIVGSAGARTCGVQFPVRSFHR